MKVSRKPIQRWSAARKRDVVLWLLRRGSIDAVSRQVAVEPYRLEQGRERGLAGLNSGLRAEDDPVQAGLGAPLPAWRAACLFTGRGRAMSAAISPATSQSYGVQRVCRIWGPAALIVLSCRPWRH